VSTPSETDTSPRLKFISTLSETASVVQSTTLEPQAEATSEPKSEPTKSQNDAGSTDSYGGGQENIRCSLLLLTIIFVIHLSAYNML